MLFVTRIGVEGGLVDAWILQVWTQYPWIQHFQQYCTSYVLQKYCGFWAKTCNTAIQVSCNTCKYSLPGRVSESIHVSRCVAREEGLGGLTVYTAFEPRLFIYCKAAVFHIIHRGATGV